MNITIVTQFYPPETGGGGIATYAKYVALGLLARGHQVRVVSRLAPGSTRFQVIGGVHVYRIPTGLKSRFWTRLPVMSRYVRFARDVAYAWRVRQALLRIARDDPPDIVEYADIDAEGLFHPSVSPYVVKLHAPHRVLAPYYTRHEVPYSLFGVEMVESRTIRRADGLSSPSLDLAREVEHLCRLDSRRVRWVPNPIDTDFFSPAPGAGGDNPLTVLYVGRLEHRKGAVVLAEAIPAIARSVPKVCFVFAGADRASPSGTSQRTELEAYFERHGVRQRVRFYGHASPEVYRDLYRRATVFVMPSLYENCPYTLLEAMACGKPCVVSRAGGIREMIIDGETGLLFESGNSEGLAEAVIGLLQSPGRRGALGEAARQVVSERYSLEVGAEATEKFYRDVLANRAR